MTPVRQADAPIPVTVLTGYLGAGKTTLLNRLLSENHGKRYAVVINEFGELGVDNDLVVDADEEVFEMNNGCICCTVRGDLIRSSGTFVAPWKPDEARVSRLVLIGRDISRPALRRGFETCAAG